MQFKVNSSLNGKSTAKGLNASKTDIYIFSNESEKSVHSLISEQLPTWQKSTLKNASRTSLSGKSGPIYLEKIITKTSNSHSGLLEMSPYAASREQIGSLFTTILADRSKEINLHFSGVSDEEVLGSIVGLELALYRYDKKELTGSFKFTRDGKKLAAGMITKAKSIALAVNQARHLVNLPPNELNPVSYANSVKDLFKTSKTIKVKVLDEKKLQKENCNLLLSVGMSSNNKPRIVHLQYRPKGAPKKSVALVGKGITFDSGGLDMKGAAGMRYMKKDMGGSACLVGFSRWLETSGIKKNVDIYLSLAENAISEHASRPSDIFKARNGLTVEIHNTDAEGRLALADAIDLALDLKPETIIDVATLTGAGKVALGQDIASLFSNDDELANRLQTSSSQMGDLIWRMPLYNPYFVGLSSDYADMVNSASGHGGAITAALFLEKFVGKTKWAHLDIFSWTNGSKPSLVQKGGSGQGVETLIGYFSK
ncbi:M17 family metallopeptidase [Halobacteriovorax sp.]|uniref:leucyl aminopeptidase family protein n=1 Tax=Halobacteriovorax sp. TaxID=2020862 RepID=UPI0035633FA9